MLYAFVTDLVPSQIQCDERLRDHSKLSQNGKASLATDPVVCQSLRQMLRFLVTDLTAIEFERRHRLRNTSR